MKSAKKIMALLLIIGVLCGLPFSLAARAQDVITLDEAVMISATATTVTVQARFSGNVWIKNKDRIMLAPRYNSRGCSDAEAEHWQLYVTAVEHVNPVVEGNATYASAVNLTFNKCTCADHADLWGADGATLPDPVELIFNDFGEEWAQSLVDEYISDVFVIGQNGERLMAKQRVDDAYDVTYVSLNRLALNSATLIGTTKSTVTIRAGFSGNITVVNEGCVFLAPRYNSLRCEEEDAAHWQLYLSAPVEYVNPVTVGNRQYSSSMDLTFNKCTCGDHENLWGDKGTELPDDIVLVFSDSAFWIDPLEDEHISGDFVVGQHGERLVATDRVDESYDVAYVTVESNGIMLNEAKFLSATDTTVTIQATFSDMITIKDASRIALAQAPYGDTGCESKDAASWRLNGCTVEYVDGKRQWYFENWRLYYIEYSSTVKLTFTKCSCEDHADLWGANGEIMPEPIVLIFVDSGETEWAKPLEDEYISDTFVVGLDGKRLVSRLRVDEAYDVTYVPVSWNRITLDRATIIASNEATVTVRATFSAPVCLNEESLSRYLYLKDAYDTVSCDSNHWMMAAKSMTYVEDGCVTIDGNTYSSMVDIVFDKCICTSHASPWCETGSVLPDSIVLCMTEIADMSNTWGEKNTIGKWYAYGQNGEALMADTRFGAGYAVAYVDVKDGSTLQGRLNMARDDGGGTVVLYEDAAADQLSVSNAVTLDLNGHILTADVVLSIGDVIDSTEGIGGIRTAKNETDNNSLILSAGNDMIALYDEAFAGYRFFGYDLEYKTVEMADPDVSKYAIRVGLPTEEAYALLDDEANRKVLHMELVLVDRATDEEKRPIVYTFKPETMEKYVTLTTQNPEKKYGITLTVYGMKAVAQAGLELRVTPCLSFCGATYRIPDAVEAAKAWISAQIENNTLFSFNYDGVAYEEHIESWDKTVVQTESGWTVTYTKDGVTVWSEIAFDKETAAIEWTNYFKNESPANSPVISDILAIDSTVTVQKPVLTTAKGSTSQADDFAPITVDLDKKTSYSASTYGGRSSQGAFPYFDVSNGDYGIMAAIGWSGNWKADFVHDQGTVAVTAGMQETNISLYAGEQMRTPMVMLQFFTGDQDDGHNAFRRLILKSYTPEDETGEPVTELPIFQSVLTFNSEEDLIARMQDIADQGREVDGIWIDAVWYGGITAENSIDDNYWKTQNGNWYLNPDRFPQDNLDQLNAWLDENGKELLMWFEPEQVAAGSQIAVEHPEWLLSGIDQWWAKVYLFDLTDDEACDYLIDLISDRIQKYRIDWYRHDFNTDPEDAWAIADGQADRVGISEIKYITNLYRYLDTLVENNPGLMIDNCSSGGRRLDLEMTKRAIPYWRTDVCASSHSSADSIRSINYDLTWWLPLHGGGYPQYNNANFTYNMRSYMSAGLSFGLEVEGNEAVLQKLLAQNRTCRSMMHGDYYMLSYGVGDEVTTKNAAYQFHVPEESRGYIMTFRPVSGTQEESTYLLRGLKSDVVYDLVIADTGEKFTMSGSELMSKGWTCSYPQAATSLLVFYSEHGKTTDFSQSVDKWE